MRGLVLEGGGAKGAFHCGAVKALYDYGYTFDGVAGTSIGAINGALIVQDGNYDSLYDLWTHVSPSDISDFDNEEVNKLFNKDISGETIKYWLKTILGVVSNGGVSSDKALSYLKKYINEDKVRSSKMDLAIVTYCLSDRQPLELFKEDIPAGSLHDFVFASAHFPAFKLERFDDGKFYIDGGFYNNLPLNILSKKGYNEIIAVRTMSRMPHKEVDNHDVKVDFICPSEDLGKTMRLFSESVNYNIKLGYYDALRFIKGYKGYKYYIDGDIDLATKIINKIDDKVVENICEFAKIDKKSFYDILREKVIEEYKLPQDISEDDIWLRFFEIFAKFYGVEKFKIYTQKQFFETLVKRCEIKTKIEPSQFSRKFNNKTKMLMIFQQILPTIKEVVYE